MIARLGLDRVNRSSTRSATRRRGCAARRAAVRVRLGAGGPEARGHDRPRGVRAASRGLGERGDVHRFVADSAQWFGRTPRARRRASWSSSSAASWPQAIHRRDARRPQGSGVHVAAPRRIQFTTAVGTRRATGRRSSATTSDHLLAARPIVISVFTNQTAATSWSSRRRSGGSRWTCWRRGEASGR